MTDYPILEHDDSLPALIEPAKVIKQHAEMPERVVLCFFQKAIATRTEDSKARVIAHLGSEIGKNPIYLLEDGSEPAALVHPGVGAALAGGFLEELIALGGRKFIVCGGAGVLDSQINVGHVIVPDSAIRDEGLSYHYLPPAREVEPHPEALQVIEQTLSGNQVPYVRGKTWTTDALYRETPNKIARRKQEGAIAVEMEASALFAVAQFRGVKLGQMLYGGDDVGGEVWDHRGWDHRHGVREALLDLAIQAVRAL